jgi:hypothetical protein
LIEGAKRQNYEGKRQALAQDEPNKTQRAQEAASNPLAKHPQLLQRLKHFSPGSKDFRSAATAARPIIKDVQKRSSETIDRAGRVHQVRRAPNGTVAWAIAETIDFVFRSGRRRLSAHAVYDALKAHRRKIKAGFLGQ